MRTLRVDLPGRAYDIHIERGALDRAGELCRGALPRCTRLFVVTDSNVARLHLGRVVKSLEEAGFETACQEIPAGESSKKRWVCTVCGYVYEGEELPADFICPLCKHPASDFELLK